MSEKDNRDFSAEQQKFLIEEFRELHKKIEETQKRQEEILNKIAENVSELTQSITRLETRLNTLLGLLPDIFQKKDNGGNINLWLMLGQIINTILLIYSLLHITGK